MLRSLSAALRTATASAAAFSTAPAAATLRLGDKVPNFTQESTHGPLNLYDYLGDSWGVFFSHPADDTPVCTTELGRVAQLLPEFEKRNTKVLALSIDSVDSHNKWVKDVEAYSSTDVTYPIIADEDRSVSEAFDMIHPNASTTVTVRSVFVIGPDKDVKLSITYPPSTGRNFDEIIRVLDSLQLTAYHQVATPVDWTQGDDCVVVPSLSNEEAEAKFPKGFTEVFPYLRITPDPSSK